jgi:outer membrane protein
MRRSILSFAFIWCLIAANTVLARQSKTLTLESAVYLAVQKNVSVIQAQNTIEAQQAAATAAVGGLFPTISAGASFLRSQQWKDSPGFNVQDGQIIPNSGFTASNSYSAGLNGNLTLFNGFANTSNVKRANANSSASVYTLNRTEQNTIYQTHLLYLNVVRTYQLQKVSEDNLTRSKQQLERIIESNKVGAVALADVYRQQVQAGSDELALIQAQSNHEKAKADLIAFIGVEFNSEYAFDFGGIPSDIDTAEFNTVNALYANFNALVESAVEKRPDYLASIENMNSADASVTIARAAHYPTISASASYGYSGYDNVVQSSRLRDNRGLSLSLNANLPIFSGFATQSQIEQAQTQRKNADEQLKQAQRQIRVDVRKALLDLEASEKQVKVTQTSVQSAEMDRKIAEEKYNLGAGTLLDLLIANANYTTSLSNKVNAVTGYLLSKKGVEVALGTITK